MQQTLTNIEIINAFTAIKELMEIKLPTKVSWNLNKNARKMSDIITDFNEFEKKLIQEYAEKDENGELKLDDQNRWNVPMVNVKEFNEKRTELFNIKNDIEIHQIKLSDLDGYEIKGSTLFALDFLIDDTDDIDN